MLSPSLLLFLLAPPLLLLLVVGMGQLLPMVVVEREGCSLLEYSCA
jgi:hypothetical protein